MCRWRSRSPTTGQRGIVFARAASAATGGRRFGAHTRSASSSAGAGRARFFFGAGRRFGAAGRAHASQRHASGTAPSSRQYVCAAPASQSSQSTSCASSSPDPQTWQTTSSRASALAASHASAARAASRAASPTEAKRQRAPKDRRRTSRWPVASSQLNQAHLMSAVWPRTWTRVTRPSTFSASSGASSLCRCARKSPTRGIRGHAAAPSPRATGVAATAASSSSSLLSHDDDGEAGGARAGGGAAGPSSSLSPLDDDEGDGGGRGRDARAAGGGAAAAGASSSLSLSLSLSLDAGDGGGGGARAGGARAGGAAAGGSVSSHSSSSLESPADGGTAGRGGARAGASAASSPSLESPADGGGARTGGARASNGGATGCGAGRASISVSWSCVGSSEFCMNLDWSGFVGRGAGRGRDGPFRSGWNFFISYAAASGGAFWAAPAGGTNLCGRRCAFWGCPQLGARSGSRGSAAAPKRSRPSQHVCAKPGAKSRCQFVPGVAQERRVLGPRVRSR